MVTQQELSYQQYIYHKQSSPDAAILHTLFYLLPILLVTKLACFTALLRTGMTYHSIPTLSIFTSAINAHI